MMSRIGDHHGVNVAVVGATGAVGEEMRRLLLERRFPVHQLRFLASPRSAGRTIPFGDREIVVEALEASSFAGVQLALFSAGATVSREWGPRAVAAGALVVDNSSAFRMDPGTTLIVPEINGHRVPPPPALIANPNCSTIQMVMALAPLHRQFGLSRVIVATYQSTSGAGRQAMNELDSGTRGFLAGDEPAPEKFPRPIAFNLVPQVDEFDRLDYTKEEWKMVDETRKILELPDLPVTATCVRVPVHRGHSEVVWARFDRPVDVAGARAALTAFPGVVVEDDPGAKRFPTPRSASGLDPVFVGRLRIDPTDEKALVFWVVADNLLKGAALNAIQIAEAVFGGVRQPAS
ncbi:MAG: aspartate-semialdehyde dehydrogenase [Candidatus Eisenbacteria bacterium]|nr:aspartate-semialdehyde dehydrogenase [Candidatus Eisenbacteria bacterium]